MIRFYIAFVIVIGSFSITYGQLQEVNHWETIFYLDEIF